MWSAFRELDRRIRSLFELRDYLVQQEAVANSVADRVEHRLQDDRTKAEAWLLDIVRGGVSDLRSVQRAENARKMLQQIHKEALAICSRAKALDERRSLFRFIEHYWESAQYTLEELQLLNMSQNCSVVFI